MRGPADTPVGRWLARPSHRRSSWPTAVRPLDHIVVAAEDTAAGTVGDTAAEAVAAEAVAAGAVHSRAALQWDEPVTVADARALMDLCRRRGQGSVTAVRADHALLPLLQLGTWTEAGWRTRALRRIAARRLALPVIGRLAERGGEETVGLAADLAFWAGARERSSRTEWQRWTRSYVVLNYHRISDDEKPDQELIDVRPARFAAQMGLLRRLGFRPMRPEEQTSVHEGTAVLRRRAFVVTADDGFLDCTEPLRTADVHAQLLVPTADVGTFADTAWHRDHPIPGWGVDGEPLADWAQLRDVEKDGVLIGGHSRRHTALPDLSDGELAEQLRGSRQDLARELAGPIDVMAYPHGLHDARVRDAARDAGFQLAYTTQFGRNGAGTDPWCLRRIPVFRDDGLPTVLWKVVTGEPLPPAIVRLLGKAGAARRLLSRPSRAALEDTRRGRQVLARLIGVKEPDVHAVMTALATAGLDPVLAGGWGVDALVGHATRPHLDLDVVVAGDADVHAVRDALAPLGFVLKEQIDTDGVAFRHRWVLRDRIGRSVDVLPVGGADPFMGTWHTEGALSGRPVRCLTPAAQRAARTGYPWRSEDHDASSLLTDARSER